DGASRAGIVAVYLRCVALDELAERRAPISTVSLEKAAVGRADLLHGVGASGRGQIVLGGEVPIEGTVRQPRRGHQRGYADAIYAALAEQPCGSGDDLAMVLLCLFFRYAGHLL